MKYMCLSLSGLFFILTFQSVRADMPVIDFATIAKLTQEIGQLKKEYNLLNDTYENAKSQLQQTKQLVQDIEGNYGFGHLFNEQKDLLERQWSPKTWQDALQGLSGGNSQRYQQLLENYKQNNSTLSLEEYKKGASSSRAAIYQKEVETNRAASVTASYAFDDIQQHLQKVHDLSYKIEEAPNSKAATDLNSRLVAEVAYIQIQELKMQAVLNQQMAQQSSSQITTATELAKFEALPPT